MPGWRVAACVRGIYAVDIAAKAFTAIRRLLSGLDGEKLDVAFLTSAVENLEGSSCAAVTAAEVVDGTENK